MKIEIKNGCLRDYYGWDLLAPIMGDGDIFIEDSGPSSIEVVVKGYCTHLYAREYKVPCKALEFIKALEEVIKNGGYKEVAPNTYITQGLDDDPEVLLINIDGYRASIWIKEFPDE